MAFRKSAAALHGRSSISASSAGGGSSFAFMRVEPPPLLLLFPFGRIATTLWASSSDWRLNRTGSPSSVALQ